MTKQIIKKPSISQIVALANGDVKSKELSKPQKDKIKSDKLKEISNLKASYCRKCNQMMTCEKFYKTTVPHLDTNGLMSICISCANKMYTDFYIVYGEIKNSIFYMCQYLDIVYDESCIATMIVYFDRDTSRLQTKSPISKYLQLIGANYKGRPMRYCNTKIENDYQNSGVDTSSDVEKQLKLKWGDRTDEDYEFLEFKYNEYVNEHGADSPSEKDNFIQLASLLLRSRTDPTNKDVITALKEQFKLIGISPEQMRKLQAEKGTMTLGLTITQMELTDPADYYNEPERLIDVQGMNKDIKSIIRATKNFLIEGTNDFDDDGVSLDDFQVIEDED